MTLSNDTNTKLAADFAQKADAKGHKPEDISKALLAAIVTSMNRSINDLHVEEMFENKPSIKVDKMPNLSNQKEVSKFLNTLQVDDKKTSTSFYQ